jgi:hypothetical protein
LVVVDELIVVTLGKSFHLPAMLTTLIEDEKKTGFTDETKRQKKDELHGEREKSTDRTWIGHQPRLVPRLTV